MQPPDHVHTTTERRCIIISPTANNGIGHETAESEDFLTMFFGKTGVGKTTLLNALFGLEWPTDPIVACTTEPTVAKIRSEQFTRLNRDQHTVLDIAGIGESLVADQAHLQGHETWVARADRLVYVTQADTRAYKRDQQVILKLRPLFKPGLKFVLALSQVDRLGSEDEAECADGPTPAQLSQLPDKIDDVFGCFAEVLPEGVVFSKLEILPYSARTGWGMERLRTLFFDHEGDRHE